jgi:hypothetical protein
LETENMKLKFPLPDHVLKMIEPSERQKLGKGFLTMDEVTAKAEAYNERKLHAQIRNLLNLKGIIFVESRMDKKTTTIKGIPDFIFAVLLNKPNKIDPTNVTCVPIPCAWEIKVGNAKVTPEQSEMLWKLQKEPNAWRVKVIRSLQEAADELKQLGI